jgi:hypothetical protein
LLGFMDFPDPLLLVVWWDPLILRCSFPSCFAHFHRLLTDDHDPFFMLTTDFISDCVMVMFW